MDEPPVLPASEPPASTFAPGAAPGSCAFFQGADWGSCATTTLVALVVYVTTLAPDVTLGFSGIFTVGGMYAGVPHPPGYPLWTLYSWAFIHLLPFYSVAWRAALASAVAGALASGCIALMASRGGAELTKGWAALERLKPGDLPFLRAASGGAAGLVFAFNGGMWSRAVLADAWTLSVLMLCLVLCLLMRWAFSPDRRRFVYGAFLAYGLALTNSQMLMAAALGIPMLVAVGHRGLGRDLLLVGALGLVLGWVGARRSWPGMPEGIDTLDYVYEVVTVIALISAVGLSVWTRRLLTEWRASLACAAFFVLGLSLYLYVPIASMTNPPLNWGYARTAEGFFHVLCRGQFERLHPTQDLGQFMQQVWMYVQVTGKEFGWLPGLLALTPFAFLLRMPPSARGWMAGLVVLFGSLTLLVLAALNPSIDRQSRELRQVFFSLSYVVLALWLGWGLLLAGIALMRR